MATWTPELPSFDELPEMGGLRHSWGLWGEDDRLGAVNLVTPERTLAAARLISEGVVIPLDWSLRQPGPPLFGRAGYRQTVGRRSPTSQDEQLHDWNTQSSTQWDGFRHVRSVAHGFYNGAPDDSHGVEHWAEHGIVTRAVLADVAAWRDSQGRPVRAHQSDPITVDDLRSTLDAQGSSLAPGDVLLVRTGWIAWYEAQEQAVHVRIAVPGNLATPGLRPGEDMARFLWDSHIAAVAVDNPAMEVWPLGYDRSPEEAAALREDPAREHEIQLHIRLMPMLGIVVGELFHLERLAHELRSRGRYECFFSSSPLHLPQGIATPPNAVAVL